MQALRFSESELADLLHAVDMAPLIERPTRHTINKLRAAYRREGADPDADYPDLHPGATGLPGGDTQ